MKNTILYLGPLLFFILVAGPYEITPQNVRYQWSVMSHKLQFIIIHTPSHVWANCISTMKRKTIIIVINFFFIKLHFNSSIRRKLLVIFTRLTDVCANYLQFPSGKRKLITIGLQYHWIKWKIITIIIDKIL